MRHNTKCERLSEIKEKWVKYNNSHYSGLRNKRHKCKTPWYIINSGKQYNYEERKMSWGQLVDYFRVKSEAAKFHDKTINKKLTRKMFLSLLIESKLKDWDKKHPRPIPFDPLQRDLFEAEFMLPWINKRTEARERIIEKVLKMNNQANVYARYNGDSGYPHKLFSIRLRDYQLQLKDGSYNKEPNPIINKVQCSANRLKRLNPSLIALKIIDRNSSRIIIPM